MASKMAIISMWSGVAFLVSEIVWQLFIKHRKKLKLTKENIVAEVLMFSDACKYCRDHASSNPCSIICPVQYLKRLIYYLDSSTKTLDICMYIITCQDITEAIIRAQKRYVDVKIIVDAGMSENSACADKLRQMRRAGVSVRIARSSDSLMHHKFAIIDYNIMIYGSTNWTMQAFFGNFDGILVTNQTALVKPFLNEFNRMWQVDRFSINEGFGNGTSK